MDFFLFFLPWQFFFFSLVSSKIPGFPGWTFLFFFLTFYSFGFTHERKFSWNSFPHFRWPKKLVIYFSHMVKINLRKKCPLKFFSFGYADQRKCIFVLKHFIFHLLPTKYFSQMKKKVLKCFPFLFTEKKMVPPQNLFCSIPALLCIELTKPRPFDAKQFNSHIS